MTKNETTKARYFALGLIICLLVVPHLFQLIVPEDIRSPKMWVQAHTAVVGGSFILLFIGALGGFALAKKVLSPFRAFITSLLIGASIACFMLTGIATAVSLETIAVVSFIIGFLGCWAITELLGQSPNHSFKRDALKRAP